VNTWGEADGFANAPDDGTIEIGPAVGVGVAATVTGSAVDRLEVFDTMTLVVPGESGETVSVVLVIDAPAIPAGVGEAENAPL
jgi:hypothetical protein